MTSSSDAILDRHQCKYAEASTHMRCVYSRGHKGSHSGDMSLEDYNTAITELRNRITNAFLQPVETTVGNKILVHNGNLYIDDLQITNAVSLKIAMVANEFTRVEVEMVLPSPGDLTVNLEGDNNLELTRRRA